MTMIYLLACPAGISRVDIPPRTHPSKAASSTVLEASVTLFLHFTISRI